MSDKYFIIGIGGTGMRCIEAFTHLCAIGMFDNKEIDILSIDTDTNNGNKGRSEQLIDRYIRIKGGKQGKPTANSFFTAKLNLYKFAPEYSGSRLTYELISNLNVGKDEVKRENRALSDLFFDKEVQGFNLDHGYRAQTHLGSHLMYHCIIEAARNVKDGKTRKEDREISEFLDKIYQAGENARVFILGSVFGGTGASSIPIIPKALRDAIRIKDKNAEIHPKAMFACSLLTEYFNFNVPDGNQKKEQKIIADSNNFSRNSQAALMFYQDDKTVNSTYKRMYHIGWPKKINFSQGDNSNKTITGGGEQKNPSHVTELLSACAVYDFFNLPQSDEQQEIVYKSANFLNNSFYFEFQDFLGADKSKEYMNKLGSFIALSHIILNSEKGAFVGQNGTRNLVNQFKKNNIPDYIHLPDEETKDIDDFIKSFAFFYDDKSNVIPGWIFQVRQSVDGPFLFNSDSFSMEQNKLKEFHFGKLFDDEAHQFANHKFSIKAKDRNPYEAFRETIQTDTKVRPDSQNQKVERDNEKFLAHTYNTLTKLFNIMGDKV
ncbi:MAG: hypothetical protein JST55_16540 [Bacteroidetes bacterium]|nr:hypothetical protein [Bacteroidota bacterium]